ncbi:copper chaperone [Haladaptatus sp. NG-SE-30]
METETSRWNRVTNDLFDGSIDRTTAVVVAMVGLDVLWWVLLYTGHVPMPGMMWLMQEAGIPMAAPGAMERAVFHVGTLEAIAGYVVMWGVMMWAMMYPPMTRFTRDYAAALRGSRFEVGATVTAFLVGYNLVWALSAVVPLGFEAVLPGGIYGVTLSHTHLVIGGMLTLTGLYQLSSFKRSRLRTCCERVAPHDADIGDGLERGVAHGVSCLLVCLGPFSS